MSNRKLRTGFKYITGFEDRMKKSGKNRSDKRDNDIAERRFSNKESIDSNANMIDSIEASGSTEESGSHIWLINTKNGYAVLGQLNTKRKRNPFVVHDVQYYEFAEALLTRDQLNRIENVVTDNKSIKSYMDLPNYIVEMSNKNIENVQEEQENQNKRVLEHQKVEMEVEENRKINKQANEEHKKENEEYMKNAIVEYVTKGFSPNLKKQASDSYDNGEMDILKNDIMLMQEYLKRNGKKSTIYDAIREQETMRSAIIEYLLQKGEIKRDQFGTQISKAKQDYDKGVYDYLKQKYINNNGNMKKLHEDDMMRIKEYNTADAKARAVQYNESQASAVAAAPAPTQEFGVFGSLANATMGYLGNAASNLGNTTRNFIVTKANLPVPQTGNENQRFSKPKYTPPDAPSSYDFEEVQKMFNELKLRQSEQSNFYNDPNYHGPTDYKFKSDDELMGEARKIVGEREMNINGGKTKSKRKQRRSQKQKKSRKQKRSQKQKKSRK